MARAAAAESPPVFLSRVFCTCNAAKLRLQSPPHPPATAAGGGPGRPHLGGLRGAAGERDAAGRDQRRAGRRASQVSGARALPADTHAHCLLCLGLQTSQQCGSKRHEPVTPHSETRPLAARPTLCAHAPRIAAWRALGALTSAPTTHTCGTAARRCARSPCCCCCCAARGGLAPWAACVFGRPFLIVAGRWPPLTASL